MCYASAVFEFCWFTEVLLTVQYSACEPQPTTQQYTTNNNQNECRHPTILQRLCPLSPWLWQRRQQLMAPPLPMGPCKARTIGLGSATAGSLVWGTNASPIKNWVKDGALALGGRHLIKQTPNNLSRVRESSRRVLQQSQVVGGGCGGGHHPIVWGSEQNNKKYQIQKSILWLRWQPINSGTHNNQPTTGGCNREEYGEEVQQVGAAQEAQHHHFQGGKVKQKILNIK